VNIPAQHFIMRRLPEKFPRPYTIINCWWLGDHTNACWQPSRVMQKSHKQGKANPQ